MRKDLCLRSFDNYKDIKQKDIPLDYYNEYYKKNLDYLVCDFFWACSRKSYLPCGEKYDVYSYNAIVSCIKAGARLINLDIYSDNSGNPIIRDEYPMPVYGLPLNFEYCMKLIKNYAWIINENYPFILYLNIHTNNIGTYIKIANIIKEQFKNKLLNKKYSFAGRNGTYPFGQIPIKDMIGKIAFVVDKYPLIGILNELINAEITKDQQFIVEQKYTQSLMQYGGLISKNPDIQKLIDYNKFNITLINSTNTKLIEKNIINTILSTNLRNPKSDIYNADPIDCWKFGCQWILMNYQYYDDNMIKYITQFKDSGLILKPLELRYIPSPPPKIITQNIKASYGPRLYEQKGWYSFNI